MSHNERERHGADQPVGRAVGVPSAQVPERLVEANDGQRPEDADAGDPYVDGNLDGRSDVRSGPLQHDPTAKTASLDNDLDSTPRSDGQGSKPAVERP